MAECGKLVSQVEEPEPEPAAEPVFDPSLVQTVDGTCLIEPREGAPAEVRMFRVDVENPNAQAARAEVSWALIDLPNRPAIARTTLNPIRAEDVATGVASIAPLDVGIVPDEFQSRVRARVLPGSVQQVFVGIHPRGEQARAGSNGEHLPVANGGNADFEATGQGALAGVCSECAERSRKMSAANHRIRELFDVFARSP